MWRGRRSKLAGRRWTIPFPPSTATAASGEAAATAPFWSPQRQRYLFSGLMRCGACGGFAKISAAHFGCSTARNQGETVCTNRLTLRHDRLEREVLGALKHR
jgi:hypothetical protein